MGSWKEYNQWLSSVGVSLVTTWNAIHKIILTNAVANVTWRQQMAKMASLHAEGLTDKDLEDLESAEILEEVLVD